MNDAAEIRSRRDVVIWSTETTSGNRFPLTYQTRRVTSVERHFLTDPAFLNILFLEINDCKHIPCFLRPEITPAPVVPRWTFLNICFWQLNMATETQVMQTAESSLGAARSGDMTSRFSVYFGSDTSADGSFGEPRLSLTSPDLSSSSSHSSADAINFNTVILSNQMSAVFIYRFCFPLGISVSFHC